MYVCAGWLGTSLDGEIPKTASLLTLCWPLTQAPG